MAKIRIVGDSSGYVELAAPNAAGNNTLELPASGTKLVGADTSNNLNVTGIVTATTVSAGSGTSISSPGSNILTFGVNNTERVRINTTGVGIGTTVAEATGSTNNVGGALFLGDNLIIKSSQECGPYLFRDNDYGPDIRLYSTKGTHDSRIAKTNNSLLGQIHWHGYDGSGYSTGAEIYAVTDGNVGVGSMPARLEFKTSSSGSATPTTRMTIDSVGRVTMPYQPAFMAIGDENTTKASGSKFSFTSSGGSSKCNFDRLGNWSNANDRFTAPVTGVYNFSFGIYRQSATTQYSSIAPRVNGSEIVGSDTFIIFQSRTPSDDTMHVGSFLLNLTAGDYVELFMRNGASTITIYGGHSFFGGYLVG